MDQAAASGGVAAERPYEPDEVERFQVTLQKTKRHLTDAEIGSLINSLKTFNKPATK